jgi:hypothetical protein
MVAVLPACGNPTYIRWPPIMIAPRDGYPPPDGERGGQLWWPGGCGAGSAQPVPGGLRDRAGDGAHSGAVGEDVRDRPVQPHGDPLPGQR